MALILSIISNKKDRPLNFYQKTLPAKRIKVRLQKTDAVQPGETIITLNNKKAGFIQQKFKCNVAYSFKETQMMLV
jgi:hypothetical protein